MSEQAPEVVYTATPTAERLLMGEIIARAVFRLNGNPRSLDLNEKNLVSICAGAIQTVFDHMKDSL